MGRRRYRYIKVRRKSEDTIGGTSTELEILDCFCCRYKLRVAGATTHIVGALADFMFLCTTPSAMYPGR